MNSPKLAAFRNLLKEYLIEQYTHCKTSPDNTDKCYNCIAKKVFFPKNGMHSPTSCIQNSVLNYIDSREYERINILRSQSYV